MNRLQRGLILTQLADRLISHRSWCGHTHLQKAVYFLQKLLQVELGVQYILYKHGPYSFDLEEELLWCQSACLFEKEYKSAGYGPRLKPTATSEDHRSRFPRLMQQYAKEIDFVAERLGSKGVVDLEKLATALYVTEKLGENATAEQRAKQIHVYKPHVSESEALEAVNEYDQIARDGRALFATQGS
jgi:uncharacterized protein YwgA